MPTCEGSWKRKSKAAQGRWTKKEALCRRCCRPGRCQRKKRVEEKKFPTRPDCGHDSIPGNLESDAVLVLPGYQSGVSCDVDYRVENKRAASAQAREPSAQLVQRHADDAPDNHYRARA